MKTTNPNSVSNVNQKRGPTSGNATSAKARAFTAMKNAKAAAGEFIMNAINQRESSQNSNPKLRPAGKQDSLSPLTNKGRGPTKGNK